MPFIITDIVNLSYSELGWEASVAKVIATKRGKSVIFIIEKSYHNCKDEGWDQLKTIVQSLNFLNHEVIFNRKKVSSYHEIIKLKEQISENFIDYLPKIGP